MLSEQRPVETRVGRLATVDPNPLDTFTYQLVSGTGSTDNASFTITGDQLFTAAVLNSATQSTVSIRVRTTDPSAASFEKAITLPVMSPPAITRQPDPRRVFTGDSAVFAVEASGLEPLSYQWKKDGVDVPGGNGRILEIAPADPSQAGNYSVTVSNGDGSATSAAASLVVDAISYEKWLSQVPNATGGPVYEPLGDYNNDGIQNFLEFALGVPPGAASASGALPFITRDAIGPVFIYRAANGIQPLTYRLMKSADLVTWQAHIPAPGEVTTFNHGGFTEVWVRVPSSEPKLFLARLGGLDYENVYFQRFMALEPLIFQGAFSKTACSADLGGCSLRMLAIFSSHHVPSLFETAQRWQRAPLLERRGEPALERPAHRAAPCSLSG